MAFVMRPSHFAYACMAIALLGALGAVTTGGITSFFGAAVAGGGALASLLIYKYGYFIIPVITKFSNIVLMTDSGYEVPPSQDVIIKKVGTEYYATKFLGVRIYESAAEKSLEENVVYSNYFERAISSVKFVTKFCMMVYVKDMGDYRMKIETKKAEAQLKLSREREKPEPDILKLDRYEREVAMWTSEIEKLARGYKPMATVAYVMTTAVGISKESAKASVSSQANELKATISNALNCEVEELTGDEMLRCIEWEYMLPSNSQTLKEQI